jgi:hypothetical protein
MPVSWTTALFLGYMLSACAMRARAAVAANSVVACTMVAMQVVGAGVERGKRVRPLCLYIVAHIMVKFSKCKLSSHSVTEAGALAITRGKRQGSA